MQNQRNIILAVLLTALILFGWDAAVRYFYPHAYDPQREVTASSEAVQQPGAPTPEGGLPDSAGIAPEERDLAKVRASGARVPIDAPGLAGSISLHGAVVDDLVTKRHTETNEDDSGPARVFSPLGTPAQHFAQFGWVGEGDLPTAETVWTVPQGAKLTPETPVTLTWSNGAGQTFQLTYTIDEDYMISARQTVVNRGQQALSVKPFALINRTDRTATPDSFNVHSGPIGAFDDAVSFGPDYDDLRGDGVVRNQGRTEWLGFTDIYFMSALIPARNAQTEAAFRALDDRIYRADLIYAASDVAPGRQVSRTTRLFAGAKESDVLDRYEDGGVSRFGLAIDWGWFRWFEKPIFWVLKSLYEAVGNFGVAIILLTVLVRGMMFPIAQRQFASMAAMKAIQPKMKALQERYKDDKQKQQQEIMALYKSEGVNPLAGCLPIFLQIPVFFALYKVLILSIEMRHKPFVLWIEDLSAPDPLHILNLFGLLPFTPPSFLGIGVLAVLLGITMWLQFRLNPAQMDPIQEQMFKLMPWVMMFIMAPFAAGLLVYWITSNVLTIAQQKYLYSRHPQLKAQAEKDAADAQRAKERDPTAKAGK